MPTQTILKVSDMVRRHALVDVGDAVVVGCSGGADSICLLHVLTRGLPELQLRCTAVYVDHGLRPDTTFEQNLVSALARKLNVSFVRHQVDVPAYQARHGGSVQEVARRLRYAALTEQARMVGARRVAVGHTQSDQAETVLMQLIRGAGSTGLAAMAPGTQTVIRPLLGIRREDTEAYCRHFGLDWFEDPSNTNLRYMRSRVRHELIPYLRQYNPRIVEGLSRTADILQAEDDYLESVAQKEFSTVAQPIGSPVDRDVPDDIDDNYQGVALDIEALRSLAPALQRRVLRRAVLHVNEGRQDVSFEQIEELIHLAVANASGLQAGAGDFFALREARRLLIVPSSWRGMMMTAGDSDKKTTQAPIALPVGEIIDIPWNNLKIKADLIAKSDGQDDNDLHDMAPRFDPNVALFDWETIEPPLSVRTRRAGDRFRPLGLDGEKKIKDLMIDNKIPRHRRGQIPIVCDNKGIIWVVGQAISDRAKVTMTTRQFLRLEAICKNDDHA